MKSAKHIILATGQASSAGAKPVNQDAIAYDIPCDVSLTTKGAVFAMADGISTSTVSDVASKAAVNSFVTDYYSTPETWSVKQSGVKVLQAINAWLTAQTQNNRYSQDRGYVCTFASVIIKSNTAHLFHSGDTRIYQLANDSSSQLQQLTQDHRTVLSSQENYLNNALGIHDPLDLDYITTDVQVGDCFILATDGIYEFVAEAELVAMIKDAIAQADYHVESDAENESSNIISHIKETATDTSDTTLENNDAPKHEHKIHINAHTHHLSECSEKIVDLALANGSDDNLSIQLIYVQQLPDKQLDELQENLKQLPFLQDIKAHTELDEFSIIKELYISSRSHVYLAIHKTTGAEVVLKFPAQEMQSNQAYLDSMLMEEWIAKRVNNPHIVKAVTLSQPRSYFYTVSEYFASQPLTQWIIDHTNEKKNTQQDTLPAVRDILTQIGKGLQALHRKEIIHQDLRPENVLINAQGEVKIIDLGSAKVAGLSDIAPHNHDMLGTLAFSAPEYMMHNISTTRADIFSLGVIAYQMLSGELPYGNQLGQNYKTGYQQNRLGKITYKSLLPTQSIPFWVDCAIEKAVHLDPNKRYTEVSEFIYYLSHPNPAFTPLHQRPLLTKNPVLFWQCVSGLLLLIVIMLTVKIYG